MKHIVLCMCVIVFSLGACSEFTTHQSGHSHYIMKVTGTRGVEFSGSIGSLSPMIGLEGERLNGTVPAEFVIDGTIVGGVFKKISDKGTLRVALIRDGTVVKESETSLPKGIIVIDAVQ